MHAGYILTKAAHLGDANQTCSDDGGAIGQHHVKGAIFHTVAGSAYLAPWEQGSKAGDMTADNTDEMMCRAQDFYA